MEYRLRQKNLTVLQMKLTHYRRWNKGAELRHQKWEETIGLKAKGTLQKHYTLVDNTFFFSWGYGWTILKHLLKEIQETSHIGQWCLSPLQSRHLGASHNSPVFVGYSLDTFNMLRCSACCRPSRMWITFYRLSAIFEAFVSPFNLCCTHYIIPKAFWTTWIISAKECSSLTTIWCRFAALHFQSFWMWGPHITRAHSIVFTNPTDCYGKSSLFTHAHSSPLTLAARLYKPLSLY